MQAPMGAGMSPLGSDLFAASAKGIPNTIVLGNIVSQ